MLYARPHFRAHWAFIVPPGASGEVVTPAVDYNIPRFGEGTTMLATLNFVAYDPAAPGTNNSIGNSIVGAAILAGDSYQFIGSAQNYSVQNGAFVDVNITQSATPGHSGWQSFQIQNTEIGNVEQRVCIDWSIAICKPGSYENITQMSVG